MKNNTLFAFFVGVLGMLTMNLNLTAQSVTTYDDPHVTLVGNTVEYATANAVRSSEVAVVNASGTITDDNIMITTGKANYTPSHKAIIENGIVDPVELTFPNDNFGIGTVHSMHPDVQYYAVSNDNTRWIQSRDPVTLELLSEIEYEITIPSFKPRVIHALEDGGILALVAGSGLVQRFAMNAETPMWTRDDIPEVQFAGMINDEHMLLVDQSHDIVTYFRIIDFNTGLDVHPPFMVVKTTDQYVSVKILDNMVMILEGKDIPRMFEFVGGSVCFQERTIPGYITGFIDAGCIVHVDEGFNMFVIQDGGKFLFHRLDGGMIYASDPVLGLQSFNVASIHNGVIEASGTGTNSFLEEDVEYANMHFRAQIGTYAFVVRFTLADPELPELIINDHLVGSINTSQSMYGQFTGYLTDEYFDQLNELSEDDFVQALLDNFSVPSMDGMMLTGFYTNDYFFDGNTLKLKTAAYSNSGAPVNNDEYRTTEYTFTRSSTTGLGNIHALEAIMYPNPVAPDAEVNLKDIHNSWMGSQLVVTDALGIPVYQTTVTSSRMSISTENFSTGMYMLRMYNGKELSQSSLMIH